MHLKQFHDLQRSARKRRRRAGTHQILNLTLKHGVHADDEGSGWTQHLQQPWGQDRDVGVAANHTQWAQIDFRETGKEEQMHDCIVKELVFASTVPFPWLQLIVESLQRKALRNVVATAKKCQWGGWQTFKYPILGADFHSGCYTAEEACFNHDGESCARLQDHYADDFISCAISTCTSTSCKT